MAKTTDNYELPYPEGSDNADIAGAFKSLAVKTDEVLKTILLLAHPVGTYYETSDENFNPNETWGGTWEQDTSGTVLVSQSSDENSIFYADIGTVVGEETHTLTVSEMASHTHTFTGASHSHTFTGASCTTSSSGSHTHTLSGIVTDISNCTIVGETGICLASNPSVGTTSSSGSHNHTVTPSGTISSTTAGGTNSSTGGGGAHNNVQPSLVVVRWHRIA